MQPDENQYTGLAVRPHARAGVEIVRLQNIHGAGAFALMRGRELKYSPNSLATMRWCSPSCEGGS